MEREIAWAKGKPDEAEMLSTVAATAMFSGQMKKAEELTKRSRDLLVSQNRKENAAQLSISLAGNQALFGRCPQAKENLKTGLAQFRGRMSLSSSALVFAASTEQGQAQSLPDEVIGLYPKDTPMP